MTLTTYARKEEELSPTLKSVDASIQGLKDYIEKAKKDLLLKIISDARVKNRIVSAANRQNVLIS